jgi:hypothetical protein
MLGAWGALIPFVGPYFNWAYSPEAAWTWTVGRGWLEVLPGIVVVVGGLLLLGSRNRANAMIGSWLAIAGGVWYVVGAFVAPVLNIGDAGAPVAGIELKTALLQLTFFYGLGAVIVFLSLI